MKDFDFDYELQRHLQAEELRFRAKHQTEAEEVEWLAPYCNSVQDILRKLKELGLKIDSVVDDIDCDGEKHQWVRAKCGLVVYQNDEYLSGLTAPAYRA